MSASTPNSNKVPPAPPKRAGSTLSVPALNNQSLTDEIKTYKVEDTPVDLSQKSSFSDLTVDGPSESGGRVSYDSNDGLIQHFPEERSNPPPQNHRIRVAERSNISNHRQEAGNSVGALANRYRFQNMIWTS